MAHPLRSIAEEAPAPLAGRMVAEQLVARGVADARLLAAMERLPRHLFVPELTLKQAYSDAAFPTRDGQTISQPYMVAAMTELLRVTPGDRVLEVGTGSGYQTALLAMLGAAVFTIERVRPLAEQARAVLGRLMLGDAVHIKLGDGTLGWAEQAPFDGVLVTAGAPAPPPSLLRQLAEGGRLVIPVGDRATQTLRVYERQGQGIKQTDAFACRFVPLIGQEGWEDERSE